MSEERLRALFDRRTYGIRPGVDAVMPAFVGLGSPAADVPAIHVVGTNGKGSVAAMAAASLEARGHAVGLYTSPHLERVTERVQVRGAEVDVDLLAAAVERVLAKESAGARGLSFFEVLTLAALAVFERAGLDVLVVEAGLGGRLDTTRLVGAKAVVVTSIALDHQKWLGDTLREIAGEKAGVFRAGVPVFTCGQAPEVMDVLRDHAQTCNAPFHVVPPLLDAPLPGAHQRTNAALALAAVRVIDPGCELAPLQWPGRLERVRVGDGEIVYDVAHNPAAVESVVAELAGEALTVLFAAAPDKNVDAMAGALRQLGPLWTLCDEPEALAAAEQADRLFTGLADPELIPALRTRAEGGGTVLVCGSHRLVAAVKTGLDGGKRLDPTDPR